MIEVIDNFLEEDVFKEIEKILMGDKFPWFYQDHVVNPEQSSTEEKYQIQFVHKFHEVSNIVTGPELWNMLIPIFAVLQPHTFLRVKANNIPGPNVFKKLLSFKFIREDTYLQSRIQQRRR